MYNAYTRANIMCCNKVVQQRFSPLDVSRLSLPMNEIEGQYLVEAK